MNGIIVITIPDYSRGKLVAYERNRLMVLKRSIVIYHYHRTENSIITLLAGNRDLFIISVSIGIPNLFYVPCSTLSD